MAIPPEAYEDFLQRELEEDDLDGGYEMGSVLAQVLRYAGGRLGTTTLFYPFELSRILRQVQHVPKGEQKRYSGSNSYEFGQDLPPQYDAQGYLLAGRWPLRLAREQGLWGSTVEIARRQGLFSLWRGFSAHGLLDLVQSLGQAACEECAYALWPSLLDRPLPVTVGSSFLVACLLRPLDRARTLLACQSVWPGEQRHPSLWTAMRGKLWAGHFLFDCFSYLAGACLRILPLALTSQATEAWYERGSMSWALLAMLAEQAALSLPLLLSLPLETIRRRLQLQSDPQLATRVTVSETPYTGPWDCWRRIVREEGWSQLYQGWGWQVMQNATLLLVHTLGDRIDEADLLVEGSGPSEF